MKKYITTKEALAMTRYTHRFTINRILNEHPELGFKVNEKAWAVDREKFMDYAKAAGILKNEVD